MLKIALSIAICAATIGFIVGCADKKAEEVAPASKTSTAATVQPAPELSVPMPEIPAVPPVEKSTVSETETVETTAKPAEIELPASATKSEINNKSESGGLPKITAKGRYEQYLTPSGDIGILLIPDKVEKITGESRSRNPSAVDTQQH